MGTFRALQCSALHGQNPIMPRPGLSWGLGFTFFYQFTPDLHCRHWCKKLGAAFDQAERHQSLHLLTFPYSKTTTTLRVKTYMQLNSSSSSGRAKLETKLREINHEVKPVPAWLWTWSVHLGGFRIRAWHKHLESYKILFPVARWVLNWVWPWIWLWVSWVRQGRMLTAIDCWGPLTLCLAWTLNINRDTILCLLGFIEIWKQMLVAVLQGKVFFILLGQ